MRGTRLRNGFVREYVAPIDTSIKHVDFSPLYRHITRHLSIPSTYPPLADTLKISQNPTRFFPEIAIYLLGTNF